MKKMLMIMTAAAALGLAGAAQAQYPGQYGYGYYGGGYSGGSDWSYGRNSYALFEREYRHTIEGIRHGLRDGTFSRWQADRFYRELEGIRYEAARSMRYGSYQDRYIQARMAGLHQRMHFKHERDHERQESNDWYGNHRGYQPGYGGYDYDSGHDHHDD